MVIPESGTKRGSERCGTHLRLENLHKGFGANQVLQGIDLEVLPGEFVALVGRSGCGKSTLLRLVAGLETRDLGSVQLDGAPLRGSNAGSRIMFQDARLLPWLKVVDNVAIGLKRGERDIAARALVQVGLGDRGGDWPAILSGGQRQRVALARALVSRPRLMLLDEPLGAVDALTRLDMQRLIERLWEEQGFTALLVTHDVDEAVALADRIIVLEEGRIVQEVAVPLDRPRHRSDRAFGRIEEEVLERLLSETTVT
ncbi:MAG: ssuB [Chthonomonadaceae bacterium]|nr:ssuB [Chthonomonadaceae bacterium]